MESLNIINNYIKSTRHYINYETQDKDNIKNAKNGCKELNIVKKDLQELAQYRALAEQIGCPLEVLAKLVMGAEVYFENHDGETEALDEAIELNIDTNTNKPCMGNYLPQLPKGVDKLLFCDYKKTWWLKEDRSE